MAEYIGGPTGALNSLLTTIPNRNYRSDRPGGLILYTTALLCTVLYKKEKVERRKKRKFAHKQTDKNQTFQKLKSTLRGSWPTSLLMCTTYVLGYDQYILLLINTQSFCTLILKSFLIMVKCLAYNQSKLLLKFE